MVMMVIMVVVVVGPTDRAVGFVFFIRDIGEAAGISLGVHQVCHASPGGGGPSGGGGGGHSWTTVARVVCTTGRHGQTCRIEKVKSSGKGK